MSNKPRTLLILALIVLLPCVFEIENLEAQQVFVRAEVNVTVQKPSMNTEDMLTELKFTLDYNMTAILTFTEKTNVSIDSGLLGHYFNYQPTDVWVRDNLGNEFSPVFRGSKVETPNIENVTVQPNFDYTVTLHFKITEPKFDNELKQFRVFYALEKPILPLQIFFKFPKEYEVFQQSAIDAFIDNEYKILYWDFPANQQVICDVIFLPFSIGRTIKTMEFISDIPMYDDSTSLYETLTITYQLPSILNVWKTALFMPMKIPIPDPDFEIESVSDGQDFCDELSELPINSTTKSQLGRYYKDDDNGEVWIFPRFSFENDFTQIEVSIKFKVPNNVEAERKFDIKLWEPYRSEAGVGFRFTETDFWSLNLTTFKVKIILPPDVEFINSTPEKTSFNPTNDNRLMVGFVYNSPITIPENKWVVLYDNITLKEYNTRQLIIIGILAIYLVSLLISSKFFIRNIDVISGIFEVAPATVITPFVLDDLIKFFGINSSNLFFLICIIFEVILCLTIICYLIFLISTKRKKESNNNPNSQPKSKFAKNPFAD